jgi:hypothetical protein
MLYLTIAPTVSKVEKGVKRKSQSSRMNPPKCFHSRRDSRWNRPHSPQRSGNPKYWSQSKANRCMKSANRWWIDVPHEGNSMIWQGY